MVVTHADKSDSDADASSQGRMLWMGLDVSSEKADYCVRHSDGKPIRPADIRKLKSQEFKRTRAGAQKTVEWAKKQLAPGDTLHFVMESTGCYSAELAFWLAEICPKATVSVMPPAPMKNYLAGIGLRNKTDKLDAIGIACYGAQQQPAPRADPAMAYVELKALTRAHQVLAERATEVKNQSHANDSDHVPKQVRRMIEKINEQQIALFKKQQQGLVLRMREVVESDPALARDVELVCTIKGVAFMTAVTVFGELGDLRLYNSSRQLTSFAGLNPVIHQSGKKIGKSHISKQGSSHVRRGLYMSAMSAVRHNPHLRQRQQRLTERGKPGIVALTANMRVLLTIMRALLVKGKTYDPFHVNPSQAKAPATPSENSAAESVEVAQPAETISAPVAPAGPITDHNRIVQTMSLFNADNLWTKDEQTLVAKQKKRKF